MVNNNARHLWNKRYRNKPSPIFQGDGWLAAYHTALDMRAKTYALDLGCGYGVDSSTLHQLGFQTISCDFSEVALHNNKRRLNDFCPVQLNLGTGRLPFADNIFQVIVANLSLHYFNWHITECLCRDIQRILTPTGLFLARFNSVRDIHHGSRDGIEQSKNFRRMPNGDSKRFFTEAELTQLFQNWNIQVLEEKVLNAFDQPKIAWELVAKRHSDGI